MKDELDLSKYDGAPEEWIPRANLDADAPLLLAEVRRLREELKVQREMHNVCLEIHTESESCLHAEQQLEALRQSHARLLEAIKSDSDKILPDGSLCWCVGERYRGDPHEFYCADIRAAVAEAEDLS